MAKKKGGSKKQFNLNGLLYVLIFITSLGILYMLWEEKINSFFEKEPTKQEQVQEQTPQVSDNVSYDYIDYNSDCIYEGGLIYHMNDLFGGPGVAASEMEQGMNTYLSGRPVNNSVVVTSPFTFSTVKQAIISNRPLIIGTHDHTVYDDHCVTAHGYFESRVDGNYIIINDGARHNNVWIEPDMNTLTTAIGFAN